ncbi:MAG: hypothetical protein DSM107014_08830 [Gomphosphaeria aponina SAG 52.96 = DSM 107014]|uniref:DUF4276 family protein n=1 Tax=Gomphosphaeria aponina SAG 52.96 = DSM 107014 TaxID=1521640 RepID=A0A941GQH0_9CHRO|nr:hypothetical protein [Gomphosphaeria aponina SAG 52.96 = DSM 107014]
MKDLVVLGADNQQKAVIETLLLERYQSLGIRPLTKDNFKIFSHQYNDPGVYQEAGNFLSTFINQYQYALVIVDVAWEGTPGKNKIQAQIQNQLNKDWKNRSCTVVIDPELEIWVWSSSPEVFNILGTTETAARQLGEKHKFWEKDTPKPQQPKELMELVLKKARKPRSTAIFQKLAKEVSLKRCQDPSFKELVDQLQQWFPLSTGLKQKDVT